MVAEQPWGLPPLTKTQKRTRQKNSKIEQQVGRGCDLHARHNVCIHFTSEFAARIRVS